MMIPKKFTPISFFKKVTKRQRFVIASLLLSAGLLTIQLMNISGRYAAIGVLTLLAYLLSAWSLAEGLNGIEWLTVLALPAFFTAGVGLFYFLMPSTWLMRLPVVLVYGLGFYGLLLTENIFSVAAIRTIQLLRSAQAVGFLLTLATSFFLYNTIFAYRLDAWFNFFLIGLVSFPLTVQALWYINLEEKINKRIWFYSSAISLVLAEMALVFSFWPVSVTVGSLALISAGYIILGLVQHHLSERLFQKTIREYIAIGVVILVIIFFTTRWGG